MMQAVNYTDVVFILLATALVMLMTTPGLAFFYGGLVRRKNVLSTMMQSFVMLCLVSLQWIFGGYSLAFGPDVGHFVGNLSWFGLHGVGMAPNPDYAATIPHQLFMVYQMMFAVITPALITGAFAERMKFSSCVVFCLLWTTLVYDPVCHWVWGSGGWLKERGVLDFAGGIVVHATSGISALVCALVLGRRKGYPGHGIPPHNMTYALLGASLLWFGWFGFNAGSALAANEVAVSAFIVTNTAAAAAAPVYMAVVLVKQRFEYDDSLDAFGVHGIGGILGVIATGLFAQKAINPAGNNGLFFSNPSFLNTQLFGVFVAIAYAALLSFVILKAVDAVLGLRVKDEEEVMGLDHTQHQESAYTLID